MPLLPRVIPPRSIVTLMRADEATPTWKNQVGRQFRIGYYRKRDGLDAIWLVNDKGEYEQTIDPESLLRYFVIDRLADETDLYGRNRPPLRPIRRRPLSAAS